MSDDVDERLRDLALAVRNDSGLRGEENAGDSLQVETSGGYDVPTYWLPKWWDAVSDWSDCRTCMAYNGSPCASCEVPPGLLAMAQLVGGGVATVAGNARGNQTIVDQRQAQAAARVPTSSTANVQASIEKSKAKKLQRRLERNGGRK